MSFINDIPMSRSEEILLSIINGTPYDKDPMSRIEYLLLELKAAIEAGSSDSPIKYKGSKATVAALPTVSETPEGYMYTLTFGGTTTSDFVEGAGHTLPRGENVAAVNVGTEENPVMKWDTLGGITDGLQPLITTLNKLSADLVDDTTATHKFVTAAEKQTWNGKQDALTFDTTPTENSTNPVTSGGVHTALAGKLDDKTTHTTINGIDVYVSNTQPTGDIAVDSVGFGW